MPPVKHAPNSRCQSDPVCHRSNDCYTAAMHDCAASKNMCYASGLSHLASEMWTVILGLVALHIVTHTMMGKEDEKSEQGQINKSCECYDKHRRKRDSKSRATREIIIVESKIRMFTSSLSVETQ